MPRIQSLDTIGFLGLCSGAPIVGVLSLFAALLGIAPAGGCSKVEPNRVVVHPVTGQVTFDGRAAAGAFVVFHSKSADANFPAPRAQVDRQGSYALTTYRSQDGAPAGEYVLTVELRPIVAANGEFEPGPNILPPRYSQPQTSKIVVRVVAGANVIPIQIVR
jgi:hypothetical protein